ncbi:hypothetical protein A3H85_03435 [Candidatus Daviesbacteria bacterium RIFCSPLOWO2_02_FULL_40_8]|uniref:Chromosomal replication initiator protein DnaA n=1 Tax=Candidatus Daviesbacteria bacterium RIFCSPLOWO2_01_FULL_40_24 TaxID=1797787 RepID=A0A1F5MKB4_9BACT|nr:MAG: hypothetical protein A2780_02240 [Candidatus Daviesbacteria bacterium RIFCSPHIGHO2_01_FULL_41_45]OGE34132.1 MAG: hypothetical protein A3C32_00875 [Candidatus Daviesbacteria bacterium RIFCSPHIGHO2_02_FULL_41_14]OGE65814.1 MAG: hypothetical protein A3B49_03380 [Candidatus Daviesbacteria bacterium RIFCSPLOWO2_01_FULL_40_24]OGE66965.1 MAG: hypothetical protein A3H85_03435 [Candidatus Daviesbacteria bacterium RIFCSPLOWO2_02_FULL_40_8]
MESQWKKVLDYIKEELGPAHYRTWFAKSTILSQEDGRMLIGVPSAFIKDQINAKYLNTLNDGIKKVFPEDLLIELKVDGGLNNLKIDEPEMELELYAPTFRTEAVGVNPKYNMTNFVVGLSNNLAYAAAQAVVQNPGISYNPLFIYGGTGVGKTHLMHAIGNDLLQKNPTTKIIYCSSEKFMNDFIESIKSKRTNEFRHKYRSCDLLLIDDIQFISGRDSTQEEFFHTFNELQGKNSQIVLTSDRPPNEIQKVESRLVSRFQGGLTVDIQIPDFDTRVAILRAKSEEKGDFVPEECLTAIAESMPTNARELEGKFIQIIQSLKLTNKEINIDNVHAQLGKPISATGEKIEFKKVLLEVNQYFSIKMADITGPRRKKEFVLPRHLAMYLLYEECKLPYQRIGELLGGRDHTTILHGVEKIREQLNRDREIQRVLIELRQQLSTTA